MGRPAVNPTATLPLIRRNVPKMVKNKLEDLLTSRWTVVVLKFAILWCLVLALQNPRADAAGWDGLTPWYSDSSKRLLHLKQLCPLFPARWLILSKFSIVKILDRIPPSK